MTKVCVAAFIFAVLIRNFEALPTLETVDVEIVKGSDATSPFNQRRTLRVPLGYTIEVYARVPSARFLLSLPNDDILVSQPSLGKVSLVSLDPDTGYTKVTDFLTGANQPHDMVLYTNKDKQYVYISEAHQVARYLYQDGDQKPGAREVVVSGLPYQQPRPFRHPLKNIAIGNNTLYVAIGSSSNDETTDLTYDPKHAAIYGYPIEGKNVSKGRLISEGVRNAEGLAFEPGTNNLWVVVNQRDNIQYPHKDETGNYGKVVPDYVDNNPPEEFTLIEEGKNGGWPYCNPVPSDSMDDLDYIADAQRNPDETVKKCNTFKRVVKGMEPHSAPLGFTFWSGVNVPDEFANGAMVGLHGSWNRQAFSGHKVLFFPWENGKPGKVYELVAGWVTDASKKQRWGRPVDMAVMSDGSVAISDDQSGTVYRLYKP